MLKKMDKTLLITSMLLFIIGLIMILSASNVASVIKFQKSITHFFFRQAFFLIVGGLIAYFIVRFKTSSLAHLSVVLLLVMLGCLIFLYLYGSFTNQSKSWIYIAGAQFQPSEFVKICIIPYLAYVFQDGKRKFSMLISIAMVGIDLVLIALQPDFGTALIFAGVALSIYLAMPIGRKARAITTGSLAFLAIVGILIVSSNFFQTAFPRQYARFDYTEPCSSEKILDSGGQVCNSIIAFNNGGLMGKGLGNSTQKYLYLPEAYTDFIFAIIVEEIGLVGGIIILFLILIVLWRIYVIGRKSKTNEGKLICVGVFTYILLHLFINVGGVTGLIPLTGVPFPFMSYGGSYALCLIAAIAFVERVAVENYQAHATKEKIKKLRNV